MIKGTFAFTQVLSLLTILVYIYVRTKDKSTLWVLSYFLYFFVIVVGFKFLYPDIPCPSPTIEYTIALIMAGIPFLIMVILVGIEVEKDRKKAAENIASIYKIDKSNLIFWGCIILLNLIGFLLEKK